MDEKQAARAEWIRKQTGIPGRVPIWAGKQGWAAYADGLLTVQMPRAQQVIVPIQDITAIDFKSASTITPGHIRFVRATDRHLGTDRQDITFGSQDESIFLELKRVIEQDQSRGVRGRRPNHADTIKPTAKAQMMTKTSRTPVVEDSEEKFRAKYQIPAESLLARAKGRGYVSFDGHFVTIQHIGIGRLTVGKGVKRIPYTAISSIQVKMPGWVVMGYIQFSLPGGNEVRSNFGSQTSDAANDENSMGFEGPEVPAFLALRDAVEAAQRAIHQPRTTETAPPPDDVFAQLEKLGRLRDAGIISTDEFETKKAELLARM